jgi:PAS domain S-box-containing protein
MLLDLASNMEIDNACCVDEAFKKLAIGHYDVVVSDYEMPQKDGLQFLKELREQKNDIPFILFTGRGREEVAIKALNLGANGYVNKQGAPETVYGELSYNIAMLMDHHKAKNELLEKDRRLAKLAAQTPGMFYQFLRRPDGSFCVPYASNNIQAIFGCSPQDVLDDFSPIAKVILPEDFDKVVSSIERSAAHITPWKCEYRVQLPGQQIHWLLGQAVPEQQDDGNVLWNGYNVDISEHKKAEEVLIETKEQAEFERKRLETILDAMPSAVVIIDAQSGKFSYVNKRAMQLYGFDTLGLSLDENVGKVKAMRVDGTEYPIEEMPVSRSLRFGQEVRNEEMLIEGADGQVFPIIANTAPLRDMKGNIVAAIVIFEDITERKKAEAMIQRQNSVLSVTDKSRISKTKLGEK